MKIKTAADVKPEIDALNALSGRVDVDDRTRQNIEKEMRFIKAGAKAERDAAFEIEFYVADRRDVMTIHGLRVECGGRAASIDHLILTSALELWVCESKSVAEVVEINEHGEWSTYFRGNPRGIASPIEQNRRHVRVLEDVFATGMIESRAPTGLPWRPEFKSLVIVSKRGRVSRPPLGSHVIGIDTVIKSDQVVSKVDAARDEPGQRRTETSSVKAVDDNTLEVLARQLVDLHRPLKVDWAARFGLPPAPPLRLLEDPPPLEKKPPEPASMPVIIPIGTASRAICAICRTTVSRTVVDYCRGNASLFGDAIYCIACQKQVSTRRLKTPG